jgi:Kdo2-lipid IVA lauroyltransferase/acyltransferase
VTGDPASGALRADESGVKGPTARARLEYWTAAAILKFLSLLPRPAAIWLGQCVAAALFFALPRLRRIGRRNLALAFPDKSPAERKRLLRASCANLGRMAGEFSQFKKMTRDEAKRLVSYNGLERYERAMKRGRGVIFLTGHIGVWELSAFAHALNGYPLNFMARPIDNPLVDALVNDYRLASGNRILGKTSGLRAAVSALRRGEAVGILADVNVQRRQGVFCDFFGVPACSTPLVAALALRTGAAVVPGYLTRNRRDGNYTLTFEPPVRFIRTGDMERDIEANVARCTKVIECVIRRHPDQWLWIHRRWKTRPEGAPEIY